MYHTYITTINFAATACHAAVSLAFLSFIHSLTHTHNLSLSLAHIADIYTIIPTPFIVRTLSALSPFLSLERIIYIYIIHVYTVITLGDEVKMFNKPKLLPRRRD